LEKNGVQYPILLEKLLHCFRGGHGFLSAGFFFSLWRNNNGITVGVGVRAENVDGGENLVIDGNMAFFGWKKC
jgi:hypothetical protein